MPYFFGKSYSRNVDFLLKNQPVVARPYEIFYNKNEELQVYYCDWSKETDTRIHLSEAQAEELLNLLEPYGSTLTSDVLKSEFSSFYRIRFGVSMTLTVDAERGKYGDQGASYMFVMEKTPGAFIEGTYVDAALLDFLEEQLVEEAGNP